MNEKKADWLSERTYAKWLDSRSENCHSKKVKNIKSSRNIDIQNINNIKLKREKIQQCGNKEMTNTRYSGDELSP